MDNNATADPVDSWWKQGLQGVHGPVRPDARDDTETVWHGGCVVLPRLPEEQGGELEELQ